MSPDVVERLSEQDARALTNSIAAALTVAWDKIVRAYELRAWESLGYATWDAYCGAEFGSHRLRLPAEERQETVASLRAAGLSNRAIASATGDSEATVRRAGASPDAPDPGPVTGMDGKTYPARPRPEPLFSDDTADGHDEATAKREEQQTRYRARQRWSNDTVGVNRLLTWAPGDLCDVLTGSELDHAERLAEYVAAWGVALGRHRRPGDDA